MKRKLKILFTSYLLCIISLFLLTFNVGSLTLNIPTRAQPSGSNWCWVTSAKMIGDYWYPNNGRTEAQAVAYIKGSANQTYGGNYNDHMAAIRYITHNNYSYNRATSGFTYSYIKNKLNSGIPLTVGVTNPGHVYVAVGYNDYFDTIYLILNNPSGGIRQSVYLPHLIQGCSLGKYNDHFYR